MSNATNESVLSERLPLLPLRGLLAYPNMMLHFDVGRDKSIAALEKAMEGDQRVLLMAQREAQTDDPRIDDLYSVGTVAKVKQVVKLPGEALRVLVEGETRALLIHLTLEDGVMMADAQPLPSRRGGDELECVAYMRMAKQLFGQLSEARGHLSQELTLLVENDEDPDTLADLVAANILTRLEDKQEILECRDVLLRLVTLVTMLTREVEIREIEQRIQERVKEQIDKNQKEYYLREQIKAIQKELGDKDATDTDELRERLANTPMNEEARDKALKEIERLSRMAPGTPEIGVSRTYVEWLLDMPWGQYSKGGVNLAKARKVLEADHYGLEKVKRRILEFLAVRGLKNDMKGPILCLVGPPGVGKTSIARSVARALGREFARMSLGGVRDEAEIRGHRRTYIGAIPGRVISAIKQCGSMNPVFLFDEIDKMSSDYKGDPASAMLEVLDPEQNNSFRDHYLEVPFDLSNVLFLTTANSVDTIPRALLDRMELIEVSGYTEDEKVQIAKRHLLPKQLKQHGLDKTQLKVSEKALHSVVEDYTREAGVRSLERLLGSLCRKAAVQILESTDETPAAVSITPQNLKGFLGAPRYLRDPVGKQPEPGVVNGLAWTSVGGETLTVEVATMPGSGSLELTGQLGDVMKESAKAAYSYIRSQSVKFKLPTDFYKTSDVHIHVPEGAVPKDGPSAGVALTCAMVSALTGLPARQDVAMTGEITLRGRVLPIGGVKEKVLAAHRMGIGTVLLPKENEKDLEELPPKVREHLNVTLIQQVDQAIDLVLVHGEAAHGH